MRPLALALLSVLPLAACADGPPAPASGATVRVRGVYVQPVFDGRAIRVNHEAIPGRMPAMVMDFRLYTPALVDSVTEGARVRLTLDSASLEVLDIETLPFETDLDLDGSGRGTVLLPDSSE